MKREEYLKNLMSMVSVAMAAILLIFIFRVRGGLIGVVVGFATIAALIYWLREIKRLFGEEEGSSIQEDVDWFYDIIDQDENLMFVARVPGPAGKVKVKLVNGSLEVRGGGNFIKKIRIPQIVKIQNTSYVNGVLRVNLQKVGKKAERKPL